MKKESAYNPHKEVLRYFVMGVISLVVIQTIFMMGGFFIEKQVNIPITGIPSAIGLTLVLIIGITFYKKSEYFLLGSFTFAFISPMILGLIALFSFIDYSKPLFFYTIGYSVILIIIIWIYYFYKIYRGKL